MCRLLKADAKTFKDSAFKFLNRINPMSYLQNRIALTAGDPAGIGKTVFRKALSKLGPQKNFQFLIWTELSARTFRLPGFQTLVCKNSEQALQKPFRAHQILQIKSEGGPADWLEDSAHLCLEKKTEALVTGPVSKPLMKAGRRKALSQTALLKKLCRAKNVFMCFRGIFLRNPLKYIFDSQKEGLVKINLKGAVLF